MKLKKLSIIASLLLFLCMASNAAGQAYASDGNETSIVSSVSIVPLDMTPFIYICLALAGVFAVVAVASFITHYLDSSAIKSTTAQGIQAIVSLATMTVTASQAEEIAELHGLPTPPAPPIPATQ